MHLATLPPLQLLAACQAIGLRYAGHDASVDRTALLAYMQELARSKASLKLIETLQLVASPAWAQWGPALISSVQVSLETELHLASSTPAPAAPPTTSAKRPSTTALASASPAPPAKRVKQTPVAIAPAPPAPQNVPAPSRTAAQPTPASPAFPGPAGPAAHAAAAPAAASPAAPAVTKGAPAVPKPAPAVPAPAGPTITGSAPARSAAPAPLPPAPHVPPAPGVAPAAPLASVPRVTPATTCPASPAPRPPAPYVTPAAARPAPTAPNAFASPPATARPAPAAPNAPAAAAPAAPKRVPTAPPAASPAAPRTVPTASPATPAPNATPVPPTVAPDTRNPLPTIRAGYFPPIATGWGTLHWNEIRWHIQPFFEVQKLIAGVALAGDQWYPVSFEVPVCLSQLDPNSRVVLLTTHLNGAFLSRYPIDDRPCHARIETRSIEYVALPGGQRRVNPRFKDFLDLSPDQAHPMDVTDVLDPNAPSQILHVQALPMPGWPFVVAVAVVRKLSVDEVLAGLAKTRVSVQDRVAELRKEATDPSHDLLVSSTTVSLRDPLTMTRITVPARCKAAPHHDCFDAATFLSVNQEVPTWSCPACTARLAAVANRTIADVPGVPDTLRAHLDGVNLDLLVARNVLDSVVLDDHFAEMLKSAPAGVTTMTLDLVTGDWVVPPTETERVVDVDTAVPSDDEIVVGEEVPSASATAEGTPTRSEARAAARRASRRSAREARERTASTATAVEVIDLT
ncbi:SUMO ligase siz1 [Allomyces javanicus]|nr:SUMO ligase siz1 [Allomyces javanicus]